MQTTVDLRTGDCVKLMNTLEKESVDVVVTSPPYNLGKNYRSYTDDKEHGEYLDWCKTWGACIKTTLKEDGSFFLNVGSSPTKPTLPFEVMGVMLGLGFRLQNTIHWIKSITTPDNGGLRTHGHFKPINSKRFVNDCHEYIFHFTKFGVVELARLAVGVPYQDQSNTSRWSSGNVKRCRGNTWFIPYKTIRSFDKDRPHPATFPVALPRQCIALHGATNETVVLDPFMGLGSTGLAARELGVGKVIGFDLDEYYVDYARSLLG